MSHKYPSDRKPIIKWDVHLGRRLWIRGDKIYDIADALGITCSTVKSAAQRYGWPKRKMWRNNPRLRTITQGGMQWVENEVTKRCPDCYGVFRTVAGDYSPHPECRLLARNGTVETRTAPEGISGRVAA